MGMWTPDPENQTEKAVRQTPTVGVLSVLQSDNQTLKAKNQSQDQPVHATTKMLGFNAACHKFKSPK